MEQDMLRKQPENLADAHCGERVPGHAAHGLVPAHGQAGDAGETAHDRARGGGGSGADGGGDGAAAPAEGGSRPGPAGTVPWTGMDTEKKVTPSGASWTS